MINYVYKNKNNLCVNEKNRKSLNQIKKKQFRLHTNTSHKKTIH